MPEGDTVWRAAQRLHAALAGHVLATADLRVPTLATQDLTGAQMIEVVPRGKHLLMRLECRGERLTLRSHLRMDGQWRVFAKGQPWRGGPVHWVRAVLATDNHEAVGYRLAMLALVRTENEDALLGHLGPDVLAEDFDPVGALVRLRADPQRPLADALLDQRLVCGLGTNLIAEACFIVGVAPHVTVTDERAADVLTKAVAIARFNSHRDSRVTTGNAREPSWVHARRSCRRCGTVVQRTAVGHGSQQRSIAYCPACQTP